MLTRNVSHIRFGVPAVAVATGIACIMQFGGTPVSALSGPYRVALEGQPGSYRLVRDGRPYFIKGAGGTGSRELLLKCGANSIRTWGAENIDKILDEAQRDNLSVTVGIWLGHSDVFNYHDKENVKKQFDMCRSIVDRFKDHPALLIWAFGNEMEGYGKADDAAVWKAIDDIAAMSKKLDPNHLTMTVVSEIGGDRVKNLHELCPNIDIVGINSYGGAPTLADRYKKANGKKPYILTEFGPPGPWEAKKTRWEAPIEMSSTEKAAFYRKAYKSAVSDQAGQCLGSYAFLWGHKQEGTATWFGMILPDGSRLGSADVMAEIWTGIAPSSPVPIIKTLSMAKTDGLKAGEAVDASLVATAPEGKDLKVRWVLTDESMEQLPPGQEGSVPEGFPNSIVRHSASGAKIRVPEYGGAYRLFAYAFDGKGGAAVANVPIFVEGPQRKAGSDPVGTPLVVYSESGQSMPFSPSGWMGNTSALSLDLACKDRPHSGKSCVQMAYSDAGSWAGIAWQHPANDWGEKAQSVNLSKAKNLVFWMRGAKGGEKVKVEFGIIGKDKKYFDTGSGKLEITLQKDWKRYEIDLKGKDMSRIKTGFVITMEGSGAPKKVFIDDVRYE